MRIIQYQPFVHALHVPGSLLLLLALQLERWRFKGITSASLSGPLALHSLRRRLHRPFAIYLLIRCTNRTPTCLRTRLKHLLVPFTVAGLLLAAYFIPYLLQLPNNIKDYWTRAVHGRGRHR